MRRAVERATAAREDNAAAAVAAARGTLRSGGGAVAATTCQCSGGGSSGSSSDGLPKADWPCDDAGLPLRLVRILGLESTAHGVEHGSHLQRAGAQQR